MDMMKEMALVARFASLTFLYDVYKCCLSAKPGEVEIAFA